MLPGVRIAYVHRLPANEVSTADSCSEQIVGCYAAGQGFRLKVTDGQ